MRILGNCKNEHGLRTYLLNISAKATGVSAAKDIEKETVTYNLGKQSKKMNLLDFKLNTFLKRWSLFILDSYFITCTK
jgi:hypothetical protein